MAVNTKTIKRRIKSIGSTKKITKAMEMISAVKMRRAVATVLASRTYARMAQDMLFAISKVTDVTQHPLLARRDTKKIGIVLITSNRGLAGGFSSRLLQEVHAAIASVEPGAQSEVILTGRRGKKIYQRYGHTIAAEFNKIDLTTRVQEVLPMARLVLADYIAGKYDKIMLAYTDYVSAINQVPRVLQLLPFVSNDITTGAQAEAAPSSTAGKATEYLFEPGSKAVLDILLPRLVEAQIYQAVLESDASEHSARMLAMKNASDAASDMITELQHNFNKARQAAITQEIAEIVGGAAALN